MRCLEKNKKPGDVFPVRDSYHYPLPPGLAEGSQVTLLAFDCGYWTVEASGKHYKVFQTLVDAAFEYEWRGRWLPESDPRIRVIRQSETLVNSPAYSCVHLGCVNPPNA